MCKKAYAGRGGRSEYVKGRTREKEAVANV